MSKIRKAVFPVAGLGTRFLPATKAVPKEMLPVVDRPVIQHVVDEARAAGIEQFIFITGRNKGAIEDHFDIAYELDRTLKERHRTDDLAELARDLRRIVRERIAAGDDNETVKAYLVARYGDWVLLKPPFKGLTLILWLAPVALLTGALALAGTVYRRRPEAVAPVPLSPDEQARVASLTHDPAASGPTKS